jgi:hypothetical protein
MKRDFKSIFVGWGEVRWQGKDVVGWKWCEICVHMYVNAKMIPVETIPGIGGGGVKGEQ